MTIDPAVAGISAGSALGVLEDNSIVALGWRTVTRFDSATGEAEGVDLAFPATGLCAHPDGTSAIVAVPTSGLHRVSFGAMAGATPLLNVQSARDVAVEPASGDLLVVVSRSPGRLLRVAVDGTNARTVATGLTQPLAVAVLGNEAMVIEAATTRQLTAIDLAGGARRLVAPDLGRVRGITPLAGTASDRRVALADTDGRLLIVDTSTGTTTAAADGPEPVWAVTRMGGLGAVLAGFGRRIKIIDIAPIPPVEIHAPSGPVYLSSWTDVALTVRDPLSADDIVLTVDPPHGGLVSNSRDATFDSTAPSWLLSVGNLVGDYRLIAQHVVTGDVLAESKFSITDQWNEIDGPPLAFVGTVSNAGPDPAWGGGDPYVPQNINVHPAVGTRNVAVVILETTDIATLSAADAQSLRTRLQNEVFDGVTRGGVDESAAGYWNDVSNGQLTLLNAGVVGPIRLANGWGSYVSANRISATDGEGGGVDTFGPPAIAAIRAMNDANAQAGQPPVLDLLTVDSIILCVRSLPSVAASPTDAAFVGRYTWPASTLPGNYELDFEVGRTELVVPWPFGPVTVSIPITRRIQMFAMPDDWRARDAREFGETAAHELGHTLGLPDAYAVGTHSADAQARDVGGGSDGSSWSLMSFEGEFPLLSVSEKMHLGFVEPTHVRPLSFASLGPVDEQITLYASDLGAPPPGQFTAVEVRIRDGQNYYFEYRRETPTERSDQDLPDTRTVFATDVLSGDKEPKDRRMVLRLRDDADADRGEFQTGDDYEETDTSSPKYPNDFVMDVLQTTADSATIRIRYGDAKPDPQIRPWAQSTNWKSPDLQVTNARSQADNQFRDTPWEGHDNRVVATVRNPGMVNAVSVRVDFSVKDFTLGGGAETPLGYDVHDVPTGATVQFRSGPWVPPPLSALSPWIPFNPHYCVVARIAEYVDPANPAIREITLDNNEAQSNHTQMISVSSSPSSRESGTVKVDNPLDEPAMIRVQVCQTSPLARTYLDHAWVHLQPGETRDVRFRTESMLGDPSLATYQREFGEDFAYELPNSLRLTGIADDRSACHGLVTGGAHVEVRAARATEMTAFGRDGGLLYGRVEVIDNGQGADGVVLVTIERPGDDPEREVILRCDAHDGDFRVESGDLETGLVSQAHYLGRFDLAPCDSESIEIA